MRLDPTSLEEHLVDVAELLERYGVVLDLEPDEDLELDETSSGALTYAILGFLPDGRRPPRSVVEIREVWQPTPDGIYERFEYVYELLDHERNYRRAFHLHDREAFVRRHDVVVHEHCEQPVGAASCHHYAGPPIRDAFDGVERLVGIWVDPQPPDCDALFCLDD